MKLLIALLAFAAYADANAQVYASEHGVYFYQEPTSQQLQREALRLQREALDLQREALEQYRSDRLYAGYLRCVDSGAARCIKPMPPIRY